MSSELRFTPNDLDVLLHYYTSPEPHARASAPAVNAAIVKWGNLGMLALDHGAGRHETTEKARVWIEHILRTPLPVAEWAVPSRIEQAEALAMLRGKVAKC